ncbi:MAG: hypothetical protein A2Y34_06045 [Spirochaetes bacterium GWC1_27_15]|nr:MAG: hypothetical protein A2Z98_17230 [Spirochaetes bacterium GWB1_27_13]OHD22347.1 MAG: hypothetical protein A2Y34_06045 [Spirochaetes bacterium GWC1_27_15]
MKPPEYIDNAKVILWDWSDSKPFGIILDTNGKIKSEIYGLAICKYEKTGDIYRFSCDKNWKTKQDANYDTIENAILNLPQQYKNISVNWKEYE